MAHRSVRPWTAVAVVGIAALIASCGGNDPGAVEAPDATEPAVTEPAGTEPGSTGTTQPADTGTDDSTVPTSAPPAITNPPTTTNPEVLPVAGGSLVVGLEADTTGYNPTVDAWARSGHQVARAIFDPLATFDAEGKVVPYLAESITANDDSTVWTITVRPGISFHNGEPLDAAAVKANFDAVLASAQYSAQLALVSEVAVVDDLTVEVRMSAPWGAFVQTLVGQVGTQVGYMAAPAMLADPEGGRNPIGTGPFTFVEWVPDDRLVVARNDDYWQGAPYLDEVVFRPIPDSTSRIAAVEAGDVDLVTTGSSKDILEFQESEAHTVFLGTPVQPDMLMFNVTSAPVDDVRVRRAMIMALDVPRLFDFLESTGVKQPLDGPYAPTSFWHVDSEYPEYDVDGARALVEEYEAEVGPVVVDFQANQDPFLVSYQELFQSMWAEIGIDTNIVSKTQSENIADVVGGTYQLMMWGGQGGGDPDQDYAYFHSGGLNFTRYNSPEIDAAMDAGRALSDPEARKEQYAIVQEAFGRDVPYAWIGTNVMAVISSAEVQGIADFTLPDGAPGTPVDAGVFFLKDVWLAR